MSWKSGDRAIFRSEREYDDANLNGRIVTLLRRAPEYDGHMVSGICWVTRETAIETEIVSECSLYPLDGSELSTWEHCVFKPKKVNV